VLPPPIETAREVRPETREKQSGALLSRRSRGRYRCYRQLQLLQTRDARQRWQQAGGKKQDGT
jgi:hypothetical protein